MIAHPPPGFEDGLVLAPHPFGGVRSAVIDHAHPHALDAFEAVMSYSLTSSNGGSMPSFSADWAWITVTPTCPAPRRPENTTTFRAMLIAVLDVAGMLPSEGRGAWK